MTNKQNHIKTDRKVNVLQRKVGERETDWLKNRQTSKQTNIYKDRQKNQRFAEKGKQTDRRIDGRKSFA